MKEVLRKLNELDACTKDAKRLALLRDFLRNDELFKEVVILATSGTMHFNIKNLPPVINNDINLDRDETIKQLFIHLNYLALSSGANKKDKEWIAKLAANLECGTIVIDRILNKKLKCSVTSKTVNKAWPNLIDDIPYMRCSTEEKIDNIVYESEVNGELIVHGAYYDEKLDGMFFDVIVENNTVKYRSRNGKEYKVNNEKLDSAFIKRARGFNVAFTGEGRIYRKGKILDRKTGNGLITKILKGTAKQQDHDDLFITIWDVMPLKDFWEGYCATPLKNRYESKFFEGLTHDKGIIRIPFRKIVFSKDEALALADWFIANGGEGGVLKNMYSVWKDGTSPDWIKLKQVVDCEMEVVKWEFGERASKYENCMGKVLYKSACGLIFVWVGGGFSDEQRNWNWDDLIGTISTIRFSEIITSKTKDTKSFFLPRYVEQRPDKDSADTYEEILILIKNAKKKQSDKEN